MRPLLAVILGTLLSVLVVLAAIFIHYDTNFGAWPIDDRVLLVIFVFSAYWCGIGVVYIC